jgi:ChrB-like protein
VWVLLAYRVPREPSTPRIAIWRRLKRLGVAQLGDGLVALPADARTQEQLEWVADLVAEAGGGSTLWRAELLSRSQEQALIERLAAARAEEYAAITSRAVAAVGVSQREAVRVLRGLRRELRQVQRRDFFPPVEQEQAKAAVKRLAARVQPAKTPEVSS